MLIFILMQIMISTGTEHANHIESIVTDTESQVFLEWNTFFLPYSKGSQCLTLERDPRFQFK